ncbi:MAG: hypothetical protein QME96_09040 [Myxococcota bacterium]|nr:hypothetical protein [Myxococcota bacterium]
MEKTRSTGVAAATGTAQKAGTFLAALENPENAAVLAVMKDPQKGKMTGEAIERGKALVVGARAALGDAAAGKAELPVITNQVLFTMGRCHETLRKIAVHVRGYLRENPAGLPTIDVKTLLASFNGLIDGSAGQAALPARVRALVAAARQDPSKSAMAKLMRDAGINEQDLAAAERAAGTATGADAQQETGKGGKIGKVSAKDAIVGALQGWYSRWSSIAYNVLTPEQEALLGLPRRAKGGGRRKRKPGAGGGAKESK